MAVLMPNGKQSYINSAGAPLVGGKLFTYDAGTNNPRVTYSDAAGTVPNTNPVILDARGEAFVFWSGTYKVVLQDAAGATLWTADNLTSANQVVDTLVADLGSTALNKGSKLVAFIQRLVGAVGRWVEDKLSDTLSVKDFGAVGDGVTNDTASIQAAVASVPAYGGSLYFPRGTYLISSTITLPPFRRLKIYGDGNGSVNNGYSATVIRKAASLNGEALVLSTDASSVESLTVQGVAGNGGDGILIKASRCTLRDVSTFGMGRDGIRIGTDSGGENCNLWLLDNVKSKSNGRHGVYLSEGAGPLADCNAGTMLHPDLQSNGSHGLAINGAQLNTIVGGAYQNNSGYGIYFSQYAKYNVVYGGDIEANVTADVRIDAGAIGNAIYNYTTQYSQYSISATTENNRIECLDHNRLISGIKFPPTQVPSADANTLDDYEEVNSFTPVVKGATTAGVGTYTEQKGTATKIGDRVQFEIDITWTAHTGTGNLELDGLPFFPATGGANPRYIPVELIQVGGPAPGAGKTRIAFLDTGIQRIQLREFDPATATVTNSNAITPTGTLYVRGAYRS